MDDFSSAAADVVGITPARDLPVPVWRDLVFAALSDSPDDFALTLNQARKIPAAGWEAQVNSPGTFVLLAAGQPAGFIAVSDRGQMADCAETICEIEMLWLRAQVRGTTAIEGLLTSAKQFALSRGADVLVAWVMQDSTPAQGALRRHGWRPSDQQRMPDSQRPHLVQQEFRFGL